MHNSFDIVFVYDNLMPPFYNQIKMHPVSPSALFLLSLHHTVIELTPFFQLWTKVIMCSLLSPFPPSSHHFQKVILASEVPTRPGQTFIVE